MAAVQKKKSNFSLNGGQNSVVVVQTIIFGHKFFSKIFENFPKFRLFCPFLAPRPPKLSKSEAPALYPRPKGPATKIFDFFSLFWAKLDSGPSELQFLAKFRKPKFFSKIFPNLTIRTPPSGLCIHLTIRTAL